MRTRYYLPLFLAALSLVALPNTAQAQDVIFNDFTGAGAEGTEAFSGNAEGIGAGAGTTVGVGDEAEGGLSFGVNPGAGGGFAGFVVRSPAGTVDATSATHLSFQVNAAMVDAANLPLTMEINLHEDANASGAYEGDQDDEFQAEYQLTTEAGYQLVQIPLRAFRDDNAVFPGQNDGFDFSQVLEVVIAFSNLQGPELRIELDEVLFTSNPRVFGETTISFNDFTGAGAEGTEAFSGNAEGIGAGAGTTVGVGDEAEGGLSFGVNPGAGGGFAGFVVRSPAGTVDATSATHLSFQVNAAMVDAANLPLTMEINLHEDANGSGAYEGDQDDEFQAEYQLTTEAGYQLVQIPLRAFRDDNAVFPGQNDGFDFSQVLEVVIAFSNLQGPELRIEMDEIAFVSGTVETSNEEIDAVLPTAYQLSAAYPNPFNPQAEFTLSLQQAQEVRVEVFDVLGRSVEVLFDGLLPAQSTQRFTINAQDWPSGTYLYRVVGQNFSETRSVVLLK